jgi:hypothetical protein
MPSRTVIVIGTGSLARDLLPYLRKNFGVIDFTSTINDGVGLDFYGYKIVAIEQIINYPHIIVASSFDEEIMLFLSRKFPMVISKIKTVNLDDPVLGLTHCYGETTRIIRRLRLLFLLPILVTICSFILLSIHFFA